jgi:hypothetical protein
MCHSPAAAHASAHRGPVDVEQVLGDVAGLCGPGMERNARDFIAHVRAHSGTRNMAYSGVRSIVGTGVEDAPEQFDYRAGFELPV